LYTESLAKRYRYFLLATAIALATPVTAFADATAPGAGYVQPVDQQVAPAMPNAGALMMNLSQQQVAPGVTLTIFDRLDRRGWTRGHMLTVDMTHAGVSTGLLYPGVLTNADTLTNLAGRAGAVAAVNGDFFDIANTKLPLGLAVAQGQWLKSAPVTTPAAGVGVDRLGYVAGAVLEAKVTLPTGIVPVAALNQYTVPDNGVGLYTPVWGQVPFVGAAYGSAQVKVITVKAGQVAAIAESVTPGMLGPDTMVLVGREAGAAALADLKVGDPVGVQFAAPAYDWAIGGEVVLAFDGKVAAGLNDVETGPRTAMGFSADGKSMYLLAVDGRQAHSRGLTRHEMAGLMVEVGASQALGLDGGGSTELVARTPGWAPGVINSPSDGVERKVANGIGVWAAPGSGKAVGLTVAPTLGAGGSAATGGASGGRLHRVFPGTFRLLTARAYDETYAPVALPGAVTWAATAGTVTSSGWFIAPPLSGKVTVTAAAGEAAGTTDLQVLGELERVVVEPARLSLSAGGSATFTVTGYDAEGRSAPIDPMNVSLSYDAPVVTFPYSDDGKFRVKAVSDGSTLVHVRVKGKEATLAVGVGHTAANVEGLENPAAWAYSASPSTVPGAVGAGVGAGGGPVLKLTYDFSQPGATSTRAAYIQAAQAPLALPGQPDRVGLWVKGDGSNTWLRAVVQDAAGKAHTFDLAKQVSWSDWRYVEVALPASMSYPVGLERIYPVETDKAKVYKGELLFAGLILKELNRVEPPASPELADRLAASLPDEYERLRAGVLFDGAALHDALAAHPEMLVTVGATMSMAGPVPVVNLLEVEGRRIDYAGTRFLALDTSGGSVRTTDVAQWSALQAALKEAAADETVKNVAVVTQLAPGRWSDAKEARLLEQWLGAFREESGGKGAALVTGGGPGAGRYEGVNYVYAGAWSELRLAPEAGGDWLRWQAGGK
jgi:hypothetical protein